MSPKPVAIELGDFPGHVCITYTNRRAYVEQLVSDGGRWPGPDNPESITRAVLIATDALVEATPTPGDPQPVRLPGLQLV